MNYKKEKLVKLANKYAKLKGVNLPAIDGKERHRASSYGKAEYMLSYNGLTEHQLRSSRMLKPIKPISRKTAYNWSVY